MSALHRPIDSRITLFCARALTAVNIGLAIGFAIVGYRNLAQAGGVVASDFTVFWTGWTLILQGQASALYDEAAQRATQELLMYGMHFEGGLMAFLNPPHAALVSTPVGWLANRMGEHAAFVVWTMGNLVLLGVLVRSLMREWSDDARAQRWMLGIAIVGFYPVFCAVRQGQTSILLALAVLGVYRAANAGHDWRGSAWLLVLTIKPQMVPMVVVFLAVRGCWRMLACAGAMLTAAVLITGLALGPAIWLDYLQHVHTLERFWGSGTPDYMVNVRGALTRMFGLGAHVWIDPACYAVWLGGMFLVGVTLLRRRTGQARDARPAYALAIAAALLTSPHLFIHDAIVWTIPLVLYTAARRDAAGDWRPFAYFALAWPLVFLAAGSLNIKSGQLTWLDPHTWVLVAATAMIAYRWPSDDVGEVPARFSLRTLRALR
jgi:hypothetical protein